MVPAYISAGVNGTFGTISDVSTGMDPDGLVFANLGGSVLYVLTEDPKEAKDTFPGFSSRHADVNRCIGMVPVTIVVKPYTIAVPAVVLVANGKACGCAFPAHQRLVKPKRVLGYWVPRWPHPVVLFKPRRVFEYALALLRGFVFYGLGRLCPISVNRRSQGGKRRIPSGRAPIGFILLILLLCVPVTLGADSGAKSSDGFGRKPPQFSGTRDGFQTWWLSFLGWLAYVLPESSDIVEEIEEAENKPTKPKTKSKAKHKRKSKTKSKKSSPKKALPKRPLPKVVVTHTEESEQAVPEVEESERADNAQKSLSPNDNSEPKEDSDSDDSYKSYSYASSDDGSSSDDSSDSEHEFTPAET